MQKSLLTQLSLGVAKSCKFGIEYSLAPASDGPCPRGWGGAR